VFSKRTSALGVLLTLSNNGLSKRVGREGGEPTEVVPKNPLGLGQNWWNPRMAVINRREKRGGY